MRVFADLHIHGRYSQATSDNLTVPNLAKWARVKGINLLGTGDFTHPKWIEHIKESLKNDGNGVFKTSDGFPFILSSEISLVYTQGGKGRRVHNVILAPDLEIVKQITDYLLTKGRIDYDGRPIFKIPCPEFTERLTEISKDVEIIPAHCLVPDSWIHVNNKVKQIKNVSENDFVLTHKGRYKKVKKVYKRMFSGDIIKIMPACLKIGSYFTPEHPIYSIKSFKSCKNTPHTICKPNCAYLKRGCKIEAFKNYEGGWNQIKDLEKGDIILYPRYTKIVDKKFFYIHNIIKLLFIDGAYVKSKNEKHHIKNVMVKDKIEVTKEFCRLIGYYLAEGYCTRDYVAFTFSEKEQDYINDVKELLSKIFGGFVSIEIKKEKSKGISVFVHSKILTRFFESFYLGKPYRAFNKVLPSWFLDLPNDKLKELLIGWWRGDTGYTSSLCLCNQLKLIFIKLGVVPSISVTYAKNVNGRRKIKPNYIEGRKISAKNDMFSFHCLSFFNDCNGMDKLSEFKRFVTILDRKRGWMDNNYVYLPILRINKKKYNGLVYNLEVDCDNSYLTENLAVHNCWTPWFAMFGSMSGFDSVQDCFLDQTKNIHAFETGISSDPPMNWRLSQLDKYSILSFSDLHSFWPWRIGREATLFDIDLSYKNIIKAIRTKDGLSGTIEVDPNLGKYHYTGHRKCNTCMSPVESSKVKQICPVCGKQMTVGVAERVEELADRPEGFKPKDAKPFYSLIPLSEIISRLLDKAVSTKTVWAEFDKLIGSFGSELNILMDVPKEELLKVTSPTIANAIITIRNGKVKMQPGYDGEYGYPIFSEDEKKGVVEESVILKKVPKVDRKHKNLFDYMEK